MKIRRIHVQPLFLSSRFSAVFSLLLLMNLYGGSPLSAEDYEEVAVLRDKDIDEASGLAISYANPGHIWIHNDSGDKPDLFLVGMDGKTSAVVRLRDVEPYDWEDMCSFQMDGQSWLLIGDIGDNQRNRGKKKTKRCRLLLIKEPEIPKSNGQPTVKWDVSSEIKFDYEDGRWDCEGVAVDAVRREILLLTKENPADCGLYSLPLDLKTEEQRLTARRIASPFVLFATALDISPDGRTMAIGTLLNGVVVTRGESESWKDACARPGTVINLPPRKQGETICFDQSGAWLYLNSESDKQPLWRMKVPTTERRQRPKL